LLLLFGRALMERLTAYLISTGMIAFGIWIVATAAIGRASLMLWLIVGMVPIAVGAASLANEIHNDRNGQRGTSGGASALPIGE
jgi:hypothetical protein